MSGRIPRRSNRKGIHWAAIRNINAAGRKRKSEGLPYFKRDYKKINEDASTSRTDNKEHLQQSEEITCEQFGKQENIEVTETSELEIDQREEKINLKHCNE